MSLRMTSTCLIKGAEAERKACYFNVVDQLGQFDFNLVIPMPDSIRLKDEKQKENWMLRHWGVDTNAFDHLVPYQCFNEEVDEHPPEMEEFINLTRFEEARAKGKLNADIIEFRTLYTFPAPIFFEMSKQYPKLTFDVSFFDDQFSCECGKIMLRDGEVILSKIAPSYRFLTQEQIERWENYALHLAGFNARELEV